jgi:hypothetical protein
MEKLGEDILACDSRYMAPNAEDMCWARMRIERNEVTRTLPLISLARYQILDLIGLVSG